MLNTYSFSKSDFASMLQHVVDLVPDVIFLYNPSDGMLIYHNRRQSALFGKKPLPETPVLLRDLLQPVEAQALDKNDACLQTLQEGEVLEARFRVRSPSGGYQSCLLRQKVFWRDSASGTKLILCLLLEGMDVHLS